MGRERERNNNNKIHEILLNLVIALSLIQILPVDKLIILSRILLFRNNKKLRRNEVAIKDHFVSSGDTL